MRVRGCLLSLLLMTAVAFASPALSGRPGFVLPYIGYGTPSAVVIRGRVLEDKGIAEPHAERSAGENLIESVKTLETDEIPHAVVEVELAGRRFFVRADDDGVLHLEAKGLEPPLSPGRHRAEIRVIDGKGRDVRGAAAEVLVLPDEPGVAVISDFDDTVVQSHVRDRLRLFETALLQNAAQLEPVPGAPEAYQAALAAGARAIFYVSSSPHSFYERIQRFFALKGIPKGPLLLKNFGEDPLLEHDRYKLWRISSLLYAFPKMRFILVGDSGERDPEIYREVRARFPDRIAGIVIRRVPGDPSPGERFSGAVVVRDYTERPDVIAALVRDALAQP